MKTKVFVIIVTFRGRQWYDRCLLSLRSSVLPIQTVIVDNASGDDSVGYIKNLYPETHIIESSNNLGFGQANNLGIRYALDHDCDYVFLLNQDAWIEPDTISDLVNIHAHNSSYGILSPMHLTPDKSHIEKGVLQYIDNFNTTDRSFFEDLYFNRLTDVYSTKYINAAAWLIPRNVLTSVGGFDPIFFHYGEDDNYMGRVLYHGFKIGICPGVRIVHDCDNKGVRVQTKEERERRRQLPLLIKFTDLRNKISISDYKKYLIRKWLSSSFKGKKVLAKQFKDDYHFLKNNQSAIHKSIMINKTTGETWL